MKNKIKNSNNFFVRQKYTYSLLVLTIIFLTTVSSYSLLTGHLNNEVTNTNIALLNNSRISLDSQISSLYNVFIDLTMKTSIKDFMYNTNMSEYDRYKNNLEIINNLASIKLTHNLDSVYLYSSRSGSLITDSTYSHSRDFEDMSWKSFLSQPSTSGYVYTTRKSNRSSGAANGDIFTLVYTYPMPDSYNESAVVFNISEAVLFDSFSAALSKGEQLFVMDTNGKILMHSDKKKLYSYANALDFYGELKSSAQGTVSMKANDANSTAFFVTSPMTGWKFVRTTPTSPFRTVFFEIITFHVPLILLIMACAFLFMKLINPWIHKPIYSFIDRVSQKIRENSSPEQAEAFSEILPDFDNLENYFYDLIETTRKNDEQIKKNIPVMKWKLVTDIILGNQTKYQELTDTFNLLGIDLYSKNYLVMLVDVDKSTTSEDFGNDESRELYISTLASHAEDFITKVTKGVAVLQQDKKLNVLLSFESQDNYEALIVSVVELFKNFMDSCFGVTITVAVGDICSELCDVQHSYVSAANALKYKSHFGANSIIWANITSTVDSDSQVNQITSKIADFARNTNLNDFSGYKAKFDEIFTMLSESLLPFDSALQIATLLLSKIISFAGDLGMDADVLNNKFSSIYTKLYQLENIEQINTYLTDIFETVYNTILNRKNINHNEDLIENVTRFLNENYTYPELSLSYVAARFYVSEQHLSKIFKKASGVGFSQYLISLRIERAKQLLIDPSVKISEIASLVGYSNIHSFIKIFKKQVGMTPSEYKSIKSQGGSI